MIISSESMDFKKPKKLDDPQLFDDHLVFDNPKVYSDNSITDGLVILLLGFLVKQKPISRY